MARVAQIWRHPIKAIGAERLERVTLAPGRPLPLDRAWAVLTGEAQDTGAWQPCRNFARGCFGPKLMAVTAEVRGGLVTLRHPERPDLTVDPFTDGADVVDWILPIYPPERPAPTRLIPAPDEGMADASYPSVAVLGLPSLAALSGAVGQELDPRRFRGNIWLDDLAAWEELSWPGRRIEIGDTVLEVVEPIVRCRATEANPETGERDINTLAALRDHFGHVHFGVKARVLKGGLISETMEVRVA